MSGQYIIKRYIRLPMICLYKKPVYLVSKWFSFCFKICELSLIGLGSRLQVTNNSVSILSYVRKQRCMKSAIASIVGEL